MTPDEINKLQETQKKRARVVAFVLGSSIVLVLFFLMFAFVQKAEADKQRELATKLQEQLQLAMRVAEEQQAIAEHQRRIAEESNRKLVEALQEAERAKEQLKKSLK